MKTMTSLHAKQQKMEEKMTQVGRKNRLKGRQGRHTEVKR